jgi:hypothetical protein
MLASINYEAQQYVDQDGRANADQCSDCKNQAHDVHINPGPIGKASAYTKDFFVFFVET